MAPPLRSRTTSSLLACWTLLLQSATALNPHAKASSLYDWGVYGAFPRVSYESFGAQSPWINVLQKDERCDDGYIFVEPRGVYVETPGPIVLDKDGNLVWMDTQWGQAMDLKVQQFQGQDYITFWHGTDNGTFGEGYYLMINETYDVFKKVTSIGNLTGDLHEFRITDQGTALMTIYQKTTIDMSSLGIPNGWIFDSIFQEVNLTNDELIFEWRSSDFFDVDKSLAPMGNKGGSSGAAWVYFHINSIDKDAKGNYLISSRYMCAVAQISREDGKVMWQLGGEDNSFDDLSDGAATDMAWNHHASWYENTTLTLFDNGSNGNQKNAAHSRGMMVELDLEKMTAVLIHQYDPPSGTLSPSQGSVQVLPSSNVLVGWGHTPAFTEFTMSGEVLCDTHLAPMRFAPFGWAKNYRTFKYRWTGKPRDPPSVAMRPAEEALYVSWNGATEVATWQLQSGPDKTNGENFKNHQTIRKMAFETRINVPASSGPFVRAVALDAQGKVLGTSRAISKHETTITPLMAAPSRKKLMKPYTILATGIFVGLACVAMAYLSRGVLRKGYHRLLRSGSKTFKYESLPNQQVGKNVRR